MSTGPPEKRITIRITAGTVIKAGVLLWLVWFPATTLLLYFMFGDY